MRKCFLIFIVALFPLVASADEEFEYEGLWYYLHDAIEASTEGEGSSAFAEVINSRGDSYTGEKIIQSSVFNNGVTYPVTSIRGGAFSYSSVTKVELPSSITFIGDRVFAGCSQLIAVISKIEEPFAVEKHAFIYENSWNNGVETVYPSGAVLYVPSGTSSKYQALEGWNMFMGIEEGEVIEGTDGNLKYACATVSKVATVIRSDDYSSLQNVTIPSSTIVAGDTYAVKYIGQYAFDDLYNIKSVTFSEGLVAIGHRAFQYCGNAKFGGLPSSLVSIGINAFWNCNGIESLEFPEGLKAISRSSFGSCSYLRKVIIPSSLSVYGERPFESCNRLVSVISRIQSPFAINQNVFCNGWTYDENNVQVFTKSDATLYVPIGTKSAYQEFDGWNMFADIVEGEPLEATFGDLNYVCNPSFKSATVVGRVSSETSIITIPGTITIDGENYSVKSIGAGAFQGNNIESVIISSGVETIGKNAFVSCWKLNKVVLPSTINMIGEYAFDGCGSLSTVISKIGSPFEISDNVFGTNPSCTLYVPEGTKSAYQSADGWKLFAEIIEGEPLEATVDGLKYMYLTLSKTATVLGRADSEKRFITIPTKVPIDNVDYDVKAVGAGAFRDCDIDSVIISSGVETIGRNAFNYCWRLQKLELPSTLKSIGEYAFYECNNLKKVELPASLNIIEKYAFFYCSNLSIVISKIQSPSVIDNSVFASGWSYYEDGVEKYPKPSATLFVPNGTKSAYQNTDGWNMFEEIVEGEPLEATVDGLKYICVTSSQTATVVGRSNNDLYNITIPATVPVNGINYNVKSVGAGAFRDSYIETLTLSSGLETIGNYAFQNSSSLKKLELPYTIVKIGSYAFADCRNLQLVSLPSSLQTIERNAFYWCDNLSVIVSKTQSPIKINDVFSDYSAILYVPAGTKSIYQSADGWSNFEEIVEGEPLSATVDGLNYLYNSSTQTAMVVGRYDTDMHRITIPASVPIDGVNYSVRSISSGAFRNNGIDTLTVQPGVEIIGKQAFQYCNLRRIELPATITEIGNYAFFSNSNLNAVISRIEKPFKIDKSVFAYRDYDYDENGNWISGFVKSRSNLYVPEGTKSLYESTEGWSEMFSGTYEGEIQEITYGPLKYTYLTGSGAATVIAGDYSELKEVTIPTYIPIDGAQYVVKEIGQGAFEGCSNIESVTFNSGLEVIGLNAFRECYSAVFSDLPSSVKTIGERAFNNCNRIVNLNISEGVQSIGNYAYQYCNGLVKVVLPSSVTSLGEGVFAGCNSLSSVSVAEGNEKYESRDCNVIIDRSSNTLLVGCKKSVIPEGVTAIGSRAFENTQITNVQIPATVKSIGNSAFQSCRYLTELVIPEGVEKIENNAFRYCERLVSIEFPSTMKEFGAWLTSGCGSLLNVVSRIENPKEIDEYTFGEYYDDIYSRATLWVPRDKTNTYKKLGGWSKFENYDEMLGDVLTAPTITYDGHHVVMTNVKEQKASIYYSTDGSKPTILYSDTVSISNLGTIQAISKRFGSFTVDTTRYEVTYVYDGVTARTASGGLLKNAFEWCGTDKIEMLDIDGQLNADDFGTIRGLSQLTTLNMAASRIDDGIIPSEAFANTKLQWYVSPYTMTGVGSNIFKGCQQLTAITWNSSSIELPEDVVTDVANPNMLVYAKAQAMIPYALKNVIVNGIANNIILVDSTGNSDFICPEQFMARRITYTHNYVQQTSLDGEAQGWETLALPFTVSKITHETKGVITPSAVDGAERPFWLYELGDDGLKAARQIIANVPYLICMPNNDGYGDEYILGGRVTFSAQNVTVTTSGGTIVSSSDRQFVPTYKRVPASTDVYAMNVNEAVGGNRIGSAFISNLREVRPFEAYSVHSGSKTRSIPVSSLGGGDATGIDMNTYILLRNSCSAGREAAAHFHVHMPE